MRLTEAAKLRTVNCRYFSAPLRCTGFQMRLIIWLMESYFIRDLIKLCESNIVFLHRIGASFVLNRRLFWVEDFLNWAVSCLYLGNRAFPGFSSEYPPDFSGAPLWLWTRCCISVLYGQSFSPFPKQSCFRAFLWVSLGASV